MLIYNDKILEDVIDIFEKNQYAPINYWGFKDIGIEIKGMRKLPKLSNNQHCSY